MKILASICTFLLIAFATVNFSQGAYYDVDVVDYGGPFDDSFPLIPGQQFSMDIWVRDIPAGAIAGGFWIDYDDAKLNYIGTQRYNGVELPGYWFSPGGKIVSQPDGPGSLMVTVIQFTTIGGSGGDIIIARVTFEYVGPGVPKVVVSTILCPGYTTWGPTTIWDDAYVFSKILFDEDGDGLGAADDNCPDNYNPNQEDTYPPQRNNCGDVCECEGNYDGDTDVDGSDAATFKTDFGRSPYQRPCTNNDSCSGDFNCDLDVDGTDAALFKSDFGRSPFSNPCPNCVTVPWCVYP